MLAHGLAQEAPQQAHVLVQPVIDARRLGARRVGGLRIGDARGERGGFRDLHGMRTSFGADAMQAPRLARFYSRLGANRNGDDFIARA